MSRLATVLTCLRKAKLKIKLKKGRFAESSLRVLGHIVSAAGIGPDPEKVKSVAEFPEPPHGKRDSAKLKHVQSFVGLCSYYRRFIPGFAEIARPLSRLNKDQGSSVSIGKI